MRIVALLALFIAVPSVSFAERVAVAGATGRTGTQIREVLKAEGYDVVSLTRNIERAQSRFGEPWNWVAVDVRDSEQVTKALSAVDYVICAIGARDRDGPNGPEFVDYGGVRNLVEAAIANEVKHFVLISSAAAGIHRQRSKMIEFGNIRYWKTEGENELKSSGLSYTIIGPGGLENRPSSGEGLRALSRSDYTTGLIATGDVARVAVNALTNEAAHQKTFALIRDETVDSEAWRELLRSIPKDSESDEGVDAD